MQLIDELYAIKPEHTAPAAPPFWRSEVSNEASVPDSAVDELLAAAVELIEATGVYGTASVPSRDLDRLRRAAISLGGI